MRPLRVALGLGLLLLPALAFGQLGGGSALDVGAPSQGGPPPPPMTGPPPQPPPAPPAEPEREWRNRVIVGLGGSLPLAADGFGTIADNGYEAGLEYYRVVDAAVWLGAEVAFFGFGNKLVDGATVRQKVETSASQLLVAAHFVPLPDEPVRPYLTLGFGTATFNETINSAPAGGGPDRQTFDQGSTEFGGKAGLGVETSFNKRVFGALESNWRYLTLDSSKFGRDSVQLFDVGGRVGCRF